jgi:trigger factor
MQVTELSAEGLKREYKVVVQAAEIEDRVAHRLEELKGRVRIPGFRPGKVPLSLLRKQYGRSVMGEVLEQALNHGSQKAIADHELRPALRPKIEVTSFDEGADLEFTMALEVLPEVPEVDLKKIELTRPVAEVKDETLARSLDNFARRFQEYEPPAEPRPSRTGDRLIIDFEGRIAGEPLEGGKAQDVPLVLGSGFMLPGFEDRLTGVEAGAEVTVDVTFPDDYPNADLAGKPASFAVAVKEIAAPKPLLLDDDLAKRQGFDGLDALRNAIRDSFAREYAQISRARVKRALLDHLAENYRFQVPAGMVDLEFEAIWKQLKQEMRGARRGQVRGRAEGRVPGDRRAARPPRPDPLRRRPEERAQGRAARAQRRDHGAGAALSGTGAEGARLFPQQSRGGGAPARASVRGQGGGLHPADGDRERAAGEPRGADGRR